METDEKQKIGVDTPVMLSEDEIPVDETFSYDGYQIVRGEFFAHLNEPTITFNNNKFAVNMACIKRLPDVEYVQIRIHQEKRSLIVRPCLEDEKESFVWCTLGEKKKPKQVTCKMFFAKLMKLTGWNSDHRYKVLGKPFRGESEVLFIFDLDAKQVFPRKMTDDGKYKSSRMAVLPAEWENTFGPTVEEH